MNNCLNKDLLIFFKDLAKYLRWSEDNHIFIFIVPNEVLPPEANIFHPDIKRFCKGLEIQRETDETLAAFNNNLKVINPFTKIKIFF